MNFKKYFKLLKTLLIEVQYRVRYGTSIFIDKLRGVDFTVDMTNEEAGTDSEIAKIISSSQSKILLKTFSKFNISETDSCIDFGSGKGFALTVLSRFPFKKLVGIELSEKVADISINNIKKLKIPNVEIICMDARDFQDLDEFTYFYFYDPFPMPVFESVIENIVQSLEREKRKVTLVYNNPNSRSAIENCGRFKEIDVSKHWGKRMWLEVRVYESI